MLASALMKRGSSALPVPRRSWSISSCAGRDRGGGLVEKARIGHHGEFVVVLDQRPSQLGCLAAGDGRASMSHQRMAALQPLRRRERSSSSPTRLTNPSSTSKPGSGARRPPDPTASLSRRRRTGPQRGWSPREVAMGDRMKSDLPLSPAVCRADRARARASPPTDRKTPSMPAAGVGQVQPTGERVLHFHEPAPRSAGGAATSPLGSRVTPKSREKARPRGEAAPGRPAWALPGTSASRLPGRARSSAEPCLRSSADGLVVGDSLERLLTTPSGRAEGRRHPPPPPAATPRP